MVSYTNFKDYFTGARVVLIIPREGKPDLRKQFYNKRTDHAIK